MSDLLCLEGLLLFIIMSRRVIIKRLLNGLFLIVKNLLGVLHNIGLAKNLIYVSTMIDGSV